jgi:hypothetical protein
MFFKNMITGITGIEFGSRSTADKIIRSIYHGTIDDRENIIVALSKAIENTMNYRMYQALDDNKKDQLRKVIENQLLRETYRDPTGIMIEKINFSFHNDDLWRDNSSDEFAVFPKFFQNSTALSECIHTALNAWLKKNHVADAGNYFNMIKQASSAKKENELHRLPDELALKVSHFAAGGEAPRILKNTKLLDPTTEDDASQNEQSFKL